MTFENAVSWFEIPADDLDRAITFYQTIFGCTLNRMELDKIKMATFPTVEKTIGGALVHAPQYYETGRQGVLVYLNASPDLQIVVDKIETAGGKVLVPKTQITPEYGYYAVFLDTEGNKVALHSMG